MIKFVKVFAHPCNNEGVRTGGTMETLLINTDQIGAIVNGDNNSKIPLIKGDYLHIGGKRYTDITFHAPVKLNDLGNGISSFKLL
jgi:hypothetical protein